MRYVKKIIVPGEQVLYKGSFHWLDWFWGLLLCVIVIGIFRLLWMRSVEMAITNRRLIYKRGWISRKTEELHMNRIEEVNLSQSIFGRLFGYGRVQVNGTGGGVVVLPVMGRPMRFKKELDSAKVRSEAS